ncbi:MAG TPA: PAS domain S-box protein [Gemmatimonadales bacterium]|nr:PAS domain S-box protein [Gemmatimonadales bacterium]
MFPALTDLLAQTPPAARTALALASLLALVLLAVFWLERRRRRRAEAAQSTAAGQLRTITASMREGVIAYDMNLGLSLVNPAFERLTGYVAEDLRDQEFLQYVHPDDRPALVAEWERLADGGSLRDQEYRVVTRTGQVRWCASTWEPLRDDQGRQIGYLGTEIDITERKLAEEEMRIDTELFQAVIEVQQAVAAAGLDSATVMHVIAERSRALTRASGVVVETLEGDELVPRLRIGIESPRLSVSASLSGASVRTGELQRSDDILTDPRITHDAYRSQGIRSMLVVPLRDDQHIIGALKVLSPEPAAFSDRDAKALRLLGGLVGASLEHAAAFEARQGRLEERTQALQESEQRFKQLVDAAQEGIWVADDRGVITYVNQRMAALLGYHNGAMLGRPVFDFLDATARAGAQRTLGRPEAGGESRDLRFRRQDGTELWGLVSASPLTGRDGVVVGSVGMVTDITERKRTEDRLRRSADRLAMLHDLDQAILAARSPAEIGRAALGRMRRMVPCHRCSVVLFDFPREQASLIAGYAAGAPLPAASMPLDRLSPGETLRRGTIRAIDDLAAVESTVPMLQQLRDEGMRSVLSVPLVVESEAIGEINLASSAPRGFNDEHRDIAIEVAAPLAIAIQQARLREELGRQTGELERRVAERGAALRAATAELETMLYAVSHDLRDPLRHICGFTQLLLDDAGPALDPAVQHYARRIRDGAEQMSTLVDDLVHLARVSRQDLLRRPVDLTSLAEDVVGQVQLQSEGREIDWRVQPLPTIDCDPALVRVALQSLLSNAVKFTRPRDHAVVTIRPIEHEGQAGFAVQDNGVGFKMAYAGKLFGVFQRLHRADEFEGNGAGLALVQRVAQKHGGRVWADSGPDGGATFYLTLGAPAA